MFSCYLGGWAKMSPQNALGGRAQLRWEHCCSAERKMLHANPVWAVPCLSRAAGRAAGLETLEAAGQQRRLSEPGWGLEELWGQRAFARLGSRRTGNQEAGAPHLRSLETLADNEKPKIILGIPEVSAERRDNNWISVSEAETLVNSQGLRDPASNICTLEMEREQT